MGFEPTNSKRRDLKSRAFDHFATRVLNFVFILFNASSVCLFEI